MPHGLPIITTLAIALSMALVMGLIAVKLKLPTIVGYLVAGILIGPFTPGFIANTQVAAELAEIGVMLLMFGVGLHFSIEHLVEMRKIALPGALIQIAVATALGVLLGRSWGWSIAGSVVFGLALSVASTVVLLRALETQGLLSSINGQIAVAWLIVEDLAMVIVLVLLPPLAGLAHENIWLILSLTLLKIIAFLALMLLIGRRLIPKLLRQIARTGSRELFTLFVIAAAISIAYGTSKLFGISFALGAFFAGVILQESRYSLRAAEESLPLRDAFAVLFFVSVGMLFDPRIFIDQPMQVLAVLFIIIIGKSLAALFLVLAFRYPLKSALIISVSLAQIGEFSFILAGLGVSLKLFPVAGQKLIIAGALISIAINPFLFNSIKKLINWLQKRAIISKTSDFVDPLVALPTATAEKFLSGQVVLVGYGTVGMLVAKILEEQDIPYVVIDQNRELVERLRERNIAAVFGNASDPEVLVQAHITKAGMLVLAIPDAFYISQIVNTARRLNPKIETAIRAKSMIEKRILKEELSNENFFAGKEELAKGLCRYILSRFGIAVNSITFLKD